MRNSALKLMPFQKEGCGFWSWTRRTPVFLSTLTPLMAWHLDLRNPGDDMGLGKTIQAIAALNVIKAAHKNW